MQSAISTPQSLVRLPFIDGIIVEFQPGYEHLLNEIWEPLTSVRSVLNTRQNPILLSDYIDSVIDRRLRESSAAPKHQKQIRSRATKINKLLTELSPSRKTSSLSQNDIYTLTHQLHHRIDKARAGNSQGETLHAYYRLFNYIAESAYQDGLIALQLKIPCKEARRQGATHPFSEHHLADLFSGWIYQNYNIDSHKTNQNADSWKFWLLPLGLFTGARLNELCQLRLGDIFTDTHGVTVISINNHGSNKSLKTANSIRNIPIHPKLMDMGFIQFHQEQLKISSQNGLLFPELKYNVEHRYSRTPSRFFSGKGYGLGYIGSTNDSLKQAGWSYRSLRRTFAESLKDNGVPSSSIAALLGHVQIDAKTASAHYIGTPHSLLQQRMLVDGLRLTIDLNHIHWNNFKPLFESHKHRKTRGRVPN
ncbi:MAG: tyrosine-type recombinase/integrase [Pseudomonadaceae bacterium]|nr:tyrosine-type recombinase/integrase [Pseudomonadaceae bacterium]